MATAPPYKRTWIPVDLIDEFAPAGRDKPEDWLSFLDPERQGHLDSDERTLAKRYKPGDTILFQWVERRGGADVVINPDGTPGTSLRCPDTPDMFTGETMSPPEIPTADINHFWDVGLGLIADTLAGFANDYAETVGPLREPTTVFVLMRRISETQAFRIGDDGKSLTPLPPQETPDV